MESKYLSTFEKLNESGKKPLLYGDRLVVELLPKEELKVGGIIMQAPGSDHRSMTEEARAQLCMILMVGEGYEDEEGNQEPIPYKPGEVVLLSELSLKVYTQFPGLADYTSAKIALTRAKEIHMQWDSLAAYEEYKATLNR